MNILGVHCYGHDTAAALVIDNEVVCAIEEERLTRKKHDNDLPLNAINWCLKYAGLNINKIDIIVIPLIHKKLIKKKYLKYTLDNFPESLPLLVEGKDNINKILNNVNELRSKLGYKGKIIELDHHLCHFASAYYLSGFENSVCVSIDGIGEIASTATGHANRGNLEINKTIDFPHSLGLLYSSITDYLGFKHHSSEGTVMALASYGDCLQKIPTKHDTYEKIFDEIINLEDDGGYKLNLSYFNFPFTRNGWVSKKFIDLFGKKRGKNEKVTDHHRNIASGLQKSFEKTYLHILRAAEKSSNTKFLSLSGGCALNCVANGKILENTSYKDIYIQPSSGDSGTAIGAALLQSHLNLKKKFSPKRVNHTYWGPSFSNIEVENELKSRKIKYELCSNKYHKIAKLLSEGKVIGWFQGRMEFGPRALGCRSILASPESVEIKNKINKEVKHREQFRPFAPSVLYDYYKNIYPLNIDSPFMIIATKVSDNWKQKISGTIHIDGTARVQTVTKDRNEEYYKLISEFYKITGIPVLLNTSYNLHGEAIVEKPNQALDTFNKSDIDILLIGGKAILRNHNKIKN